MVCLQFQGKWIGLGERGAQRKGMGCDEKGKGVDGRRKWREREAGVRVAVMEGIRAVGFLAEQWRRSFLRGSHSLLRLGSAALLLILWSTFLALTSLTCLCYLLLAMASAFGAVVYLGFTPGLFIVGLFAILILWMFANFWIAGTLFLVAGYLFSLNHARVLVLLATAYAVYSVQTRVGWVGVFLSLNLSFFSNDAFASLLRWCDNGREAPEETKQQKKDATCSDSGDGQPQSSTGEEPEMKKAAASPPPPKPPPTATASAKPPTPPPMPPRPAPAVAAVSSPDEMKRIMESGDHYQALGLVRHKTVDLVFLKKEYRKKAMLVHPDKNMGSPLASESFKKLQCAYEVLSDLTKKRDYDEQLRKKESITKTVCERSSRDYCSEESRRIQCTKCGNSHIWVCTSRSKGKARWCQDCCQYHHAKDGDGWVEYKGSLVFDTQHKVEIPRAFVCAESKIFDVSEWAICQGMACRPNTHRPSFHVNMVGLEKTESRYPWDLDAEMMDEDEEEFEVWLQQALASGLFCETSKRRKSWSPFKLHQLSKTKKQWRRTSC